ncbi:TIGR04283 family arsenosugar biosynthesis glycosyltransferase [Enterococcus sp. CSURQ0835]|uniref:TIGR04283 family arsenosugar biosynthesis glycosyltransferase n=1 Tax=Enterococcus sp. CSURQ0835 TaxID=2681394 RepID=UPI0013576111|nr:TIGR04283 family arsenosugar biosynthesis glycosyltransferase [Enterococcus sp. CSURQ0835]
MKFSIVIPTLNEEKNLARLLTQLQQIPTTSSFEIIVVDGGSHDQTVAVAEPYAKVFTSPVKSRGAQLKLGAEKSSGEYLWFLHADSQLVDDTDLFAAMAARLMIPGVSAGFYRLVFDQSDWFFRYLAVTSTWRGRYLGLIFGDQGLFVKRTFYQQAGGFPAVPLMEDWVLSRQLKKLGRFYYLKIPLYTSSRRFAAGKLRTHLKMHTIKLLFLLGRSPEELVQRYNKERKK